MVWFGSIKSRKIYRTNIRRIIVHIHIHLHPLPPSLKRKATPRPITQKHYQIVARSFRTSSRRHHRDLARKQDYHHVVICSKRTKVRSEIHDQCFQNGTDKKQCDSNSHDIFDEPSYLSDNQAINKCNGFRVESFIFVQWRSGTDRPVAITTTVRDIRWKSDDDGQNDPTQPPLLKKWFIGIRWQ